MNGCSFAALLLFVLAISVFATLYEPGAKFVKNLFFSLADMGWVGCVLLMVVEALTVVCAIPIIIPNSALSALFSIPLALCMSMVGYTVGVAVVYGMMNAFKWEPSDTFKGLHGVMKLQPFKYTLLARFIMMPAALKNYGLASCPITFWVYMACAVIHGVYVNTLQIALTKQLWSAKSATSYVVIALTFAVGIGSLIVFSALAHRAIQAAHAEGQIAAGPTEPLLPNGTTENSAQANGVAPAQP